MHPMAFLALGVLVGAGGVAILWLLERQRLVRDGARLAAEREGLAAALAEQRERVQATQTEVRDAFAALSREALKDNRAEFLHTADGLLAPMRETLGRVQSQLADVDRRREGSHQAVATQLRSLASAQEQLRAATEGLSSSLRSPNVRGKWGEVQLRRILELAGMLAQCDFVEKESSTTPDGARQTPDLIIRLPGGSSIVVDSKVPIDAFLSASSASNDAERVDHLKRHARQVRDHVRTLGAKEYWRQFPAAPEFVVMFLPLEPLLPAAFEQDATLLEQAASLRVIPATPMTLLALLKAVAFGWQQQVVAENAEEIQILGRELYERLTTMVDHLETVGVNIKRAADGYDSFIGSLERKVLPSARRFKELGVSTPKALETPDLLGLSVRRPRREAGDDEAAPHDADRPARRRTGGDPWN